MLLTKASNSSVLTNTYKPLRYIQGYAN